MGKIKNDCCHRCSDEVKDVKLMNTNINNDWCSKMVFWRSELGVKKIIK